MVGPIITSCVHPACVEANTHFNKPKWLPYNEVPQRQERGHKGSTYMYFPRLCARSCRLRSCNPPIKQCTPDQPRSAHCWTPPTTWLDRLSNVSSATVPSLPMNAQMTRLPWRPSFLSFVANWQTSGTVNGLTLAGLLLPPILPKPLRFLWTTTVWSSANGNTLAHTFYDSWNPPTRASMTSRTMFHTSHLFKLATTERDGRCRGPVECKTSFLFTREALTFLEVAGQLVTSQSSCSPSMFVQRTGPSDLTFTWIATTLSRTWRWTPFMYLELVSDGYVDLCVFGVLPAARQWSFTQFPWFAFLWGFPSCCSGRAACWILHPLDAWCGCQGWVMMVVRTFSIGKLLGAHFAHHCLRRHLTGRARSPSSRMREVPRFWSGGTNCASHRLGHIWRSQFCSGVIVSTLWIQLVGWFPQSRVTKRIDASNSPNNLHPSMLRLDHLWLPLCTPVVQTAHLSWKSFPQADDLTVSSAYWEEDMKTACASVSVGGPLVSVLGSSAWSCRPVPHRSPSEFMAVSFGLQDFSSSVRTASPNCWRCPLCEARAVLSYVFQGRRGPQHHVACSSDSCYGHVAVEVYHFSPHRSMENAIIPSYLGRPCASPLDHPGCYTKWSRMIGKPSGSTRSTYHRFCPNPVVQTTARMRRHRRLFNDFSKRLKFIGFWNFPWSLHLICSFRSESGHRCIHVRHQQLSTVGGWFDPFL